VLLILLLLICPQLTFAQRLFDIEFDYSYANQMREEAYLYNYNTSYGSKYYQSVHIASAWNMGVTDTSRYLWDIQMSHASLIDTTILSIGATERRMQAGKQRVTYAALDFTDYDASHFVQLVLGQQRHVSGINSSTMLILPHGHSHTSPSSTSVVAMPGIQQTFTMQFVDMFIDYDFGVYRHHNVDHNVFTVGMAFRNHFSDFLQASFGYQLYDGVDGDENSGYRLSVTVPLVYTPRSMVTRLKHVPVKPLLRPIGAVIHAT
jgi:hypothetical protein